jgi:hypothetical protein
MGGDDIEANLISERLSMSNVDSTFHYLLILIFYLSTLPRLITGNMPCLHRYQLFLSMYGRHPS